MKTMTIYEPAMCCPTGLCGVGIDAELLRISTVVNNLRKNGNKVLRYNLTSAPSKFMANLTVNNLLREKGVDGLPFVLVDEEVTLTGRYPTNDEIAKLLEVPLSLLEELSSED